jgi:hypothetical protein
MDLFHSPVFPEVMRIRMRAGRELDFEVVQKKSRMKGLK